MTKAIRGRKHFRIIAATLVGIVLLFTCLSMPVAAVNVTSLQFVSSSCDNNYVYVTVRIRADMPANIYADMRVNPDSYTSQDYLVGRVWAGEDRTFKWDKSYFNVGEYYEFYCSANYGQRTITRSVRIY